MIREKIEKKLIRVANIIGTDYGPYRAWLRKDLKAVTKNLKIKYKAELLAHIRLHKNKDAYAAAEEQFYGGRIKDIGRRSSWQTYQN